jgi:hypothetical protein
VEHEQLLYPPTLAAGRGSVGPAMLSALRESGTFRLAVCLQLFASAVICAIAGRPMLVGLVDSYETFLSAAAVFGLMMLAVALFQERSRAPDGLPAAVAYAHSWRSLRANLLTGEYIANVAIVFAAAPVAMSAFSAAKQAIPFVHPFTWDARIAEMGVWMHGDPPMWARLQPLLGHPTVTIAMDWFYHRFWTAAMLGAFVGGVLMRPSPLRRQYLLSVVLLFLVVGTLGAFFFASAGPAYYANVVGGSHNPYAPLFQYLRGVDVHTGLMSLRGEQTLWFAYTHRIEGFGLGVSAMPSMHVASAALTALFGFSVRRWLGLVLALVTIATWVASVNLGWHYSLDGYVGAFLACVIWWTAGRLALRQQEVR